MGAERGDAERGVMWVLRKRCHVGAEKEGSCGC